jgi:hypothetical protein
MLRLVRDADPGGHIRDANEPARAEEAENCQNANHRDVPAIGLGQRQANSGNLTANTRPN